MSGKFAILNPCPKKWAELEGNGRTRYCDACQKHVHALDAYTAKERERLWRESDGHVCGMLAWSSTEPVRSRRAILLGALLTAAAPLFGQSGRLRIRVTDQTGAAVPHSTVSVWGDRENITRQESVNELGEVTLTNLPFGDSIISIAMPGFVTFRRTITTKNSN